MVSKREVFKSLARLARKTKNKEDIRNALRYGVENNISVTVIRKYL